HLLTAYGVGYARVLGLIEADEALAEPIVEGLPYIWAELPHAIQVEMALTLDDFLVRRTHIIYEAEDQGVSRAGEVAERMAPLLGWGPREVERQVERYAEQVALTRMYEG
ncbi:MAG TPA: glycerol-3-phosphate dehydrogenase, partial [Anaerolineae bacterium]|nr:glycerol-3-phosphate dehydrogenase [Anaerolineae bacterium]